MRIIARFAWCCPRCGEEGPGYVDREDRTIRAGWAVHEKNCEAILRETVIREVLDHMEERDVIGSVAADLMREHFGVSS